MTMKVGFLVVALLLVAVACGDADVATTEGTAASAQVATTAAESPSETTAETAASGTEAPASTSAPDSPATTAKEPSGVDGPPAPDFTLALADGSSYQLSADDKPVYMIFWAEW